MMSHSRPERSPNPDRDRGTPDEPLAVAQAELRVREAAWRRQRAEVARLFAAGEDAAAAALQTDTVDGRADEAKAPVQRPHKRVGRSAAAPSKPAPTRDRRATPAVVPTAKRPRPRRRVPRRRRAAAGWNDWLRRRPPWMLSAAAHAALLGALALATFATLSEPQAFLSVALDEGEWDEPLAELTLPIDAAPVEAASAPQVEHAVFATVDLAELLEPVDATATPVRVALDGPPTDVEALMAEAGADTAAETGGGSALAGGAGGASQASEPGRVRFFGAESAADRVAFVVDNSGSMQFGRMETTLVELERAVKRLSHSQSFYVCFFSDQAYPMFFPESVDEMIPATPENKRRLSRWLTSVEMCLGGRLLDAVELAAATEPEVVYLLSDGDIRSPRVMTALTDGEAWDFPIHTLGMGARDADDAGKLAAIAEANDGVSRLIRATPKSLLRARRKPIRYNRQPGPVWGTRVKPWRP